MTAVDVPVGVEGALAPFAAAGVLLPSDVRVALGLGRLTGESDQQVLLAAALVVRALRLGSVCVDLDQVRGSVVPQQLLDAPAPPASLRGNDHVWHGHAHSARPIGLARGGSTSQGAADATHGAADARQAAADAGQGTPDADLDLLPWPEPEGWLAACATSPLVGLDPPPPIWRRRPRSHARPLVLAGSRLYLDRYAQLENLVRTVVRQRTRRDPPSVDPEVLRAVLHEVVPDDAAPNDQRLAVAAAVTGWVTVIAGGPGTGKTTTVATLLALLTRVAERTGQAPPRVALAAPTGKAAARLTEQMGGSPVAQTVHRLLGAGPWAGTRFEHSWQNRLPYDLVVVDETSMVSLELMARLLEALPPTCRLVLVGDPDQLASVDAGAVLADLVERSPRPAADGRERVLDVATPDDLAGSQRATAQAVRDELRRDLVRLRSNHRAEKAIADLGEAIRRGDGDGVVAALREAPRPGEGIVEWLDVDPAARAAVPLLAGVRDDVATCGAAMVEAARRGDARTALDAVRAHRLLCAHRSGPYGVSSWRLLADGWIAERVGRPDSQRWDGDLAVGRPLLVTENDRALGLWNGDTGVVVCQDDRLVAVVDRGAGEPLTVPVHRLPAVQTALAMTVHKAQGSESDRVTVLLPGPESPLLTRELLYTAVTRARHLVRVVGTESSVRAAVQRRVRRASGLRDDWVEPD